MEKTNKGVYQVNGENRTLITNLFEDSEFTEPAKAFEEAGHEVFTIEKEEGVEITGKKGGTLTINYGIDDMSPADFDALLLPGGFSPDLLRADDRFVEFTKAFMDDQKPVFCDLSRTAIANFCKKFSW